MHHRLELRDLHTSIISLLQVWICSTLFILLKLIFTKNLENIAIRRSRMSVAPGVSTFIHVNWYRKVPPLLSRILKIVSEKC